MRALRARFWSSSCLTLLRKASSRARRLEGGSGWLRNWVGARLVTRKVASETLARTVIRGVTVPCSVMGARAPSRPIGRHETGRRNNGSEDRGGADAGLRRGITGAGESAADGPAPIRYRSRRARPGSEHEARAARVTARTDHPLSGLYGRPNPADVTPLSPSSLT